MATENDAGKKGTLPAALYWLERFLIALCGVLIGAVGSSQFGASHIGVTVAIPGRVNQLSLPKAGFSQPVPECQKIVVGIATFSNGDSFLSDDSRRNTQLWAQALARCDGADLQLVGTTSSVPYRTTLSRNNVWLAKERANSVAKLFRSAGLKSVEIQALTREEELDDFRLFNDRRDDKTDERLGAVARRVDLNIKSLGSCEPLVPQTVRR